MTLAGFDDAIRRQTLTRDSLFASTLFASGAITLGYAIQRSNGTLEPWAFGLTAAVLVVTLGALLLGKLWWRMPQGVAVAVMAGGAGLALSLHLTTPPGVYLRVGGEAYAEHHRLVIVAALIIGAALAEPAWQRRVQVPALLLTHLALGLWLLKASPQPVIDVWVWHNEAYRALAHGLDPYAITMPNIYGHTLWFAPGMADSTRVFVGYPYPPVTYLLGGLGHALAGDYRYMNLAAMTATGALIAWARPGRLATLAAALYLFTPRSLFVLEQGWTEALSALGLAATVFAACRFPRALPWVFGVMVGTKQYFLFALPLVPLLLGTFSVRANVRFLVRAALIPLALTLPFVLWNPQAFFDSVVAFQARQPFRVEALSVMAFTARDGAPTLPLNLCFATVLVPLAVGLWRAPRTPASFAAVFSVALLAFFFFAKQAFTNYYFLIVAGLCIAMGAFTADEARATPASTPSV